jgi:hypothetical protein
MDKNILYTYNEMFFSHKIKDILLLAIAHMNLEHIMLHTPVQPKKHNVEIESYCDYKSIKSKRSKPHDWILWAL